MSGEMSERPWTADPIYVAVSRAAGEVVETAEIADSIRANSQELRDGLKTLEEEGLIERTEDGIRLAGGPAGVLPDPDAEEPEGDDEGEPTVKPAPERPANVPERNGPSFVARFEMQATFAGARGSEEVRIRAARGTARALEGEIADAVADALGIPIRVDLTGLDALVTKTIDLEGE